MATVGQDARIIKVASGGLDKSFLWKNVVDRRTISRLESAAKRFGSPDDGAVLGEGGEYETLAVAGPAPVWKARITIDEAKCTPVPSGAGAAYLRISGARLEPNLVPTRDISDLRTPPLLDTAFKTLLNSLTSDTEHGRLSMSKQSTISDGISGTTAFPSRRVLLDGLTGDGANPTHQTHVIMVKAITLLQGCSHLVTDIAYTSIILRNMADFASINAVYGSYFNHPNPPARVTIACAAVLPEGKDVMISLTSVRDEDAACKRALHVQSRSYWAPANIGPYSQAISVPLESDSGVNNGSLVYIAGQIPLVPSSMELPGPQDNGEFDPFALQTVLAMQHFIRIGHVMQVKQWACAVAFITATSPEEAVVRSDIARQAWERLQGLHASTTDETTSDDESDSFDIWDVKFGNARQSDKHLAMSDLSIQEKDKAQYDPPFYVIKVDALPRGASVEWVTYGLTTACSSAPNIPHLDHLLQGFRQLAIGPTKGR
jgi:diphthine-ammonia ligase